MQKLGTGIVILLLWFLLPGCSGLSVSPGDVMKAPGSQNNEEQVRKLVEDFLPAGAQLIIPRQPADISAIRSANICGNEEKELVAFYKKDYQLGIVILQNINGEWHKAGSVEEIGQDIGYADIKDLNNDKKEELLIGWSGGQGLDGELAIYTWKDNELKLVARQEYEAIAIGDLNGDKKDEFVILGLNRVEDPADYWAKASLFEFRNNSLKLVNEIDIDDYINGYGQVVLGNVSKDQKAVFLDMGIGAHSAYTDILIMENGELKSALTDDNGSATEKTFKAYNRDSLDVNGDGIIEVGLLQEPPGHEQAAMVEIPWIETWHQWDGQSGLVQVVESRWDYFGSYRFTMPEEWLGKVTLKVIDNDDSKRETIFYYIGHTGRERAELLRITTFNQKIWAEQGEKIKQQNPSMIILSTRNGKVQIGNLPSGVTRLKGQDLSEYKKLIIDETELKKGFQIVQPDWQ
ncbi:MAG: hypothetical protein PHT79_01705 [Syntrophomonadaceae bacterium]|nr:hypothetical protein [Syntrophomonadaceae bacterium]MDD3889889.1 hypothetical protein [Syntrophomonadaceae bacterium]MDD4548467.1 hypothetical protein [Syntrophomonadaceae bacterium]